MFPITRRSVSHCAVNHFAWRRIGRTQDLLIGECGVLERYHWFVRAHLEDRAGGMSNAGATSETEAAQLVAVKSSRKAGGARTV